MDDEVGPLSPAELVQAVTQGLILPETTVRQDSGSWMPAAKVTGLFERATKANPTSTSPPLPPVHKPGDHQAQGENGSSQETDDGLQVLDSASHGAFKVEVLAYRTLAGSRDPFTAQTVFFANQAGLKLKQVRITLQNGEAQVEAGALHFMHGRIEIENKAGGMGGLGKAVLNKMLTQESAFKPRYRGTGEIYLEPSLGHFLIYHLNHEEIIADKGLFYCSEASLEVGVAMQKNLSSAFLGGEGFFQTKIKGSGICVFELPVPTSEVRCIQLNNETLKVDGNFALMRTGNIEFTVEKSTKSLFGTLTSGEALLQTFRGTGKVWLAPTQGVYQRMQYGGISSLSTAQKTSHTST
jgi:uncharacterized protein (AIM24 family)